MGDAFSACGLPRHHPLVIVTGKPRAPLARNSTPESEAVSANATPNLRALYAERPWIPTRRALRDNTLLHFEREMSAVRVGNIPGKRA